MQWEGTIAFCYLERADDAKNRCLLTQQQLVVIYRGKTHAFALDQVKTINFSQRRWLLPLLSGGIVAPFMLIAIFLNLYDPWPLFVVFVLASLAFYIGWSLHPALTIRDSTKDHDFFLHDISSNLRAFVGFANRYRLQQHATVYHIARAQDWELAQQTGKYKAASLASQGFIHAANQQQLEQLRQSGIFSTQQPWVVLSVDMLKLQPEVRFEAADDPPGFTAHAGELFTHIYGMINLDAITTVQSLYH